MKKVILTFFACIMMVGLFAQKTTIENFVDGKITQDVFVEQLVNHFDQYNVTAEQKAKIQTLAVKKAENYTIISKMKADDPKLFRSKMKGQRQHMIDSLRFILNKDQYIRFMMDSRVEMADRKQVKGSK